MANISGGSIVWNLDIDNSKFNAGLKKATSDVKKASGDIEKDISKGSDSAANTFSSAMGRIGRAATVGLAVAGTAVVGMVAKSVKSFAEFEQLTGGVETLFKTSADTVSQYADNAFKTAGLSANQYMSTVTSFSASLLQGLGGDTAKAAEIGNLAVTDMSDNANKMGTSMELIQNAYQGFAKDNFMMLDNLKLGYGGTAGEMARLVNDSGVLGGAMVATAENVKDIPFDQLIQAIHKTQTEMGITGTTAKEASETISGSFNSMKASWENLLTGMANPDADIGKLLSQFLDSVKTFGKNVIPALGTALTGIVGVLDGIFTQLIEALPEILNELLPKVIETLVNLVVTIAEAIPELIPVLLDAFLTLLMSILQALPKIIPPLVLGITTLITKLAEMLSDQKNLTMILQAAIEIFLALVKALPEIIKALAVALPTLITSVVDFLTDPTTIKLVFMAGVELFKALVKAIPEILGALWGAFKTLLSDLWTKVSENFKEFAQKIGEKFGDALGNAFKGAVNAILKFVEDRINGVVDIMNKGIGLIDNITPGGLARIDKVALPRLAEGGIVPATSGGRLALVGEGGEDEAVIPLSKLRDMNIGGGDGGKVEIHVNMSGIMARSRTEMRDIAVDLVESINEGLRAKNLPQIGGGKILEVSSNG